MAYLGILLPALILLVALLASGMVLVRLYKKSNPETALVRTGVGGLKVVTGGGVLVVPGLHDLLRVNMKTMTITVNGGEGLITKDSRRVDAEAQFFIRVGSNAQAIAAAAQSLGQNTNDVAAIRSLLEGKVQDTMRAITAGMDLIELHRSRADFVQKVQQTLNKDLEPNGLELESVALTKLDETPLSRLDENNSFDITGLRARAATVEEQRKARVAIEEEAALEIARTQKENRVRRLQVEREEHDATQSQRLEVANMTANTEREEAKIAEETALARERARIERERAVRENEIESDKQIRAADIASQQSIELAEQLKAAEVAISSERQSQAEAAAAEARAKAIAAAEGVNTARILAVAEREKDVAVMVAEQEAEQRATALRVQARVEREAAEDQAAAVIAKAEADAQAIKISAAAIRDKGQAEADAIAARVEAENRISPEVMAHKERLAKIEALPAIISAMVEPARHIESFRVHQVTGVGGLTGGSAADKTGDGVMDSLFSGMRTNAVAMPILKQIGDELGMKFDGSIGDIASGLDLPEDGPGREMREPERPA
ncbi:flotillin domain-containing protein [uncultured Paracoccus sp.]|uniref:flotillin domain-containing protein n=1 Tax=uncultured Paracoccus sp. TaxID=189685 RepID=UPI0025FEC2C5|nr:flotillin domain-containing protein [uncultured Paracoccus sp.]